MASGWFLLCLILNTRETTTEPNLHGRNLLFIPKKRWNCNAEETCSVLTQWSSREPAEHNTDLFFFQAKHLSKGEKKKTLIPLWKAASNAGFGILTRQVHKTDEHTPFSKEGTKRNQDNPSWEELHAAIKALIKY